MKEGDLADYVRKRGFLEEYESSLVIRQLLEAVLYLGSVGIIHRDLKAENIMIKLTKDKSEMEAIKLIDFGFAIFKDTLSSLRTKEKYVGTPNYAAPEIMQQEDYDERVDMFSVGVIMYFMLAGRLPFDSVFNEEIYEATVECRYDIEGTHWTNISTGAKQLLQRLLVEQGRRIGPAEALKHPWIREGRELRSLVGRNRRQKQYI
jgi:serine/threonine protein kinase